jgi:acyl-coenzyme A synthetase/AMP-(fatty) acid ligase
MKLPLMRDLSADHVLAFDRRGTVTVGQFLADVAMLAPRLPASRFVLNDCADRYRFLVGFVAAMQRGQISLLPPSRVGSVWGQLGEDYPGAYCLSDQSDVPDALPVATCPRDHAPWTPGERAAIPDFPPTREVAVAFTSGSTGRPKPLRKVWGACVNFALSGGRALGLDAARPGAIVATAPAQHLYGFITSIMIPLQWGYAFNRDNPFFPEDIRLTLEAAPALPVFVTTPVHLRACVVEKAQLPALAFILSSAAPLPREIADEAEAQFRTRVYEFYGSTEVGAIALRRQPETDVWHTFDRVRVRPHPLGFSVDWDEYESAVLTDVVEILNEREFRLLGRDSDLVKIGGKRTSLIYLNQQLLSIPGVVDGAFLLDESRGGREPRLTAFIAAPGLNRDDVLAKLRARIDDVFMPRKLWLVPALPRNATGKLPRESMLRPLDELERKGA